MGTHGHQLLLARPRLRFEGESRARVRGRGWLRRFAEAQRRVPARDVGASASRLEPADTRAPRPLAALGRIAEYYTIQIDRALRLRVLEGIRGRGPQARTFRTSQPARTLMGEGGRWGAGLVFCGGLCGPPRPCTPGLASARLARQRLRRPPLCSGPSGDTPGQLRLRGSIRGGGQDCPPPRGVTDASSPGNGKEKRDLVAT